MDNTAAAEDSSTNLEDEDLVVVKTVGRRLGVMAGEATWGGVIPLPPARLRPSNSSGGLRTSARTSYTRIAPPLWHSPPRHMEPAPSTTAVNTTTAATAAPILGTRTSSGRRRMSHSTTRSIIWNRRSSYRHSSTT
ncbi:unnamed protein product, partial [Pylaiella littoralis]